MPRSVSKRNRSNSDNSNNSQSKKQPRSESRSEANENQIKALKKQLADAKAAAKEADVIHAALLSQLENKRARIPDQRARSVTFVSSSPEPRIPHDQVPHNQNQQPQQEQVQHSITSPAPKDSDQANPATQEVTYAKVTSKRSEFRINAAIRTAIKGANALDVLDQPNTYVVPFKVNGKDARQGHEETIAYDTFDYPQDIDATINCKMSSS